MALKKKSAKKDAPKAVDMAEEEVKSEDKIAVVPPKPKKVLPVIGEVAVLHYLKEHGKLPE